MEFEKFIDEIKNDQDLLYLFLKDPDKVIKEHFVKNINQDETNKLLKLRNNIADVVEKSILEFYISGEMKYKKNMGIIKNDQIVEDSEAVFDDATCVDALQNYCTDTTCTNTAQYCIDSGWCRDVACLNIPATSNCTDTGDCTDISCINDVSACTDNGCVDDESCHNAAECKDTANDCTDNDCHNDTLCTDEAQCSDSHDCVNSISCGDSQECTNLECSNDATCTNNACRDDACSNHTCEDSNGCVDVNGCFDATNCTDSQTTPVCVA